MRAFPLEAARWIAAVLRWGSFMSAGLMLAGVIWLLLAADVPLQVGPPIPLDALLGQLRDANPYAVMQAGLTLLLLTPLLRIAVAATSFWFEGERRYTLVSLVVLGIIVVSILLARAGG